jgi:hypothetical protein
MGTKITKMQEQKLQKFEKSMIFFSKMQEQKLQNLGIKGTKISDWEQIVI